MHFAPSLRHIVMEYIWLLFIPFFDHFVQSAPVKKRMVDLTYTFNDETLNHPAHKKFEMDVVLNGTVGDIPWVQNEEYRSGSHAGTHMDAPSHYIGEGGWSIEQIPLENLIAPAAVVNIERQAELDRDYLLTVRDLGEWENMTGQVLDNVILLVNSGWGKRWGNEMLYVGNVDKDWHNIHHPAISPEASQWLVDHRNIFGIGIDTLSFDNGRSMGFSSHRILLGANIFGLENVANLDKMPSYGAKLYVMPMKMKGSSGAPTRIIATYPDIIFEN